MTAEREGERDGANRIVEFVDLKVEVCLPASLFPHIIPGRFAFSLYLPQVEADGDGGAVEGVS